MYPARAPPGEETVHPSTPTQFNYIQRRTIMSKVFRSSVIALCAVVAACADSSTNSTVTAPSARPVFNESLADLRGAVTVDGPSERARHQPTRPPPAARRGPRRRRRAPPRHRPRPVVAHPVTSALRSAPGSSHNSRASSTRSRRSAQATPLRHSRRRGSTRCSTGPARETRSRSTATWTA